MKTKFSYTKEYKKALAEKLETRGVKALTASEFYSAWDLGYIGNKGQDESETEQNEKLKLKIEKGERVQVKKERIKNIYLLNAPAKQIAEYYKVSSCFVSKIKRDRVGKEITKGLEKNSLSFAEFVNSNTPDEVAENVSE